MFNKYLFTVGYKELSSWGYGILSYSNKYEFEFPMIKLRELLTEYKKKVELKDDELYKRVTIKIHNNGVVLRDVAYGRDIKTRGQYYIKSGQFIYSQIDARNGAFGIVPDELDGAIITNSFRAFDFDAKRINPKYLNLLLSTDYFLKIWQDLSVGTTNRRSVKVDKFLEVKIPVPPIEEQNRLVVAYDERIGQKLMGDISRDDVFNDLLVDLLGAYDFELRKSSGFLFDLIDSSSLYRWDGWEKSTGVKSTKYKVIPFEKIVLGKPQYGANVKGVDKRCGYRYIRITDINEDGTLNNEIKYPEKIDPKFVLQQNDFLIARSGNTVGKTLLYKTEMGPAIYAGYLVKYTLDTELVLPEYVLYYTKSILFKNWVFLNQRIAGQPNINGQEYLSFPLILPPVDVQKEIVKSMRAIFDEIRRKIDFSKKVMVQAQQEFEKAIFAG